MSGKSPVIGSLTWKEKQCNQQQFLNLLIFQDFKEFFSNWPGIKVLRNGMHNENSSQKVIPSIVNGMLSALGRFK